MDRPTLEMAFSLAEGKGPHVVSITIGGRPECDMNAVAADAVHSNTSFGYSGRHDHGQLPSLKASGHNARLLSAIGEAKRLSDEYITGLMANATKGSSSHSNTSEGKGEETEVVEEEEEEEDSSSAAKKARVEEA